MSTYDEAVDKAREIGREHGENAIADWFDTIVSYRPALLLEQVNGGGSWADGNGGPDTNPTLPAPDLSGEWADGYSSYDLERDVFPDGEIPDDFAGWASEFYDAYELAFCEAVEAQVRAACEALSETAAPTAVCRTCGETVRADASYASGWAHAAPGALHGANV